MMKDDDFKLLNGFALGRMNEQTFVIVESLSRLKNIKNYQILKSIPTHNLCPMSKYPSLTITRTGAVGSCWEQNTTTRRS